MHELQLYELIATENPQDFQCERLPRGHSHTFSDELSAISGLILFSFSPTEFQRNAVNDLKTICKRKEYFGIVWVLSLLNSYPCRAINFMPLNLICMTK